MVGGQKPARRGEAGEPRLWHIGAALAVGFGVAAVGLAGLTWLAWALLHHPKIPNPGVISLHDTVGVLQLVFASVAGAGALVALIVAYRRQKIAEADSAHDRTRVFNERFTTIAAQLGDAQPAVRLAGVHAMAGLADDWKANRQTCIDVLCAYLRMPYEPDPGHDAPVPDRLAYRASREVRLTAIRVIAAHLRDNTAVSWQGLNFDFTGVIFDGGDFRGAQFSSGGTVVFDGAEFSSGTVRFDRAMFSGGEVYFGGAKCSGGTVRFDRAKFSGGTVSFRDTELRATIRFDRAEFSGGTVGFGSAAFSGGRVDFGGAAFSGSVVDFGSAALSGGTVDFRNAGFSGGTVDFSGAAFSGGTVDFRNAEFSGGTVDFDHARFSGGEVHFGNAGFSGGEVDFSGAEFCGGTVDFRSAGFTGGTVGFERAGFSDGTVGFGGAGFSGGRVGFGLAEFSGGEVDFGFAGFSGGEVDFGLAKFSGGIVDFGNATFSGGAVGFGFATFSGGAVDFSRASDWSHPPRFDSDNPPTTVVKLPTADHGEPG